jgi:hypothetical protein
MLGLGHPAHRARGGPAGEPGKRTPSAPVLDPAFGDRTAHMIREQMASGDLRGVQQLFDALTDHAQRAFYASVLSRWPGHPRWLDSWINAAPKCASAYLVRGVHAVHWAADALAGHAPAGGDAQEIFESRMRHAEKNLAAASALAPRDPTPWAFMLASARALRLDPAILRERFEHVQRLGPAHRMAHSFMLQALTPYAGGSHDQMFTFVQDALDTADDGSPLFTLVAEAHVEFWLDLRLAGDPGADGYFRSAPVRDSIALASASCFDAPTFSAAKDTARNRGYFAFCSFLTGDLGAAGTQFDAIGPYVNELPWAHLGDPVKAFARAREECGGARPRAAA